MTNKTHSEAQRDFLEKIGELQREALAFQHSARIWREKAKAADWDFENLKSLVEQVHNGFDGMECACSEFRDATDLNDRCVKCDVESGLPF